MFHLKTAQNLIHWVQFCETGWWWSWYIITSQVVCWQGIAGMCPHQSKYENPPAKSWIGFIITWLIQFHLWPLEGGGAHHHSIGSRRISLPGYLGCKFLMPPPTPPAGCRMMHNAKREEQETHCRSNTVAKFNPVLLLLYSMERFQFVSPERVTRIFCQSSPPPLAFLSGLVWIKKFSVVFTPRCYRFSSCIR